MDGLTTPKSRLMRDVCRGLAGFCAGDGKSAMPDLEIGRHVRLSCSKPEALEANITGHAEDSAQWHRVATRALESRANRGTSLLMA